MKLIFSRKGFDSTAGGVPSPIPPSGQMVSLPIPEATAYRGCRRYGEIWAGHESLGALVHDLTAGRLGPDGPAHLDPDLDSGAVARPAGWRPLFGQAGAAQRLLENRGIGAGDVFLFFGWFREVERKGGHWRYVRSAPDVHVIWGWLQVAKVLPLSVRDALPAWAYEHSHVARRLGLAADSLYVAREQLDLPGLHEPLPGAGTFGHFHPALCLTAAGHPRSVWRLPQWIRPQGRRSCLGYHDDPRRWKLVGVDVLLRSVGRGQEFVLDCDDYPEAPDWCASLFAR